MPLELLFTKLEPSSITNPHKMWLVVGAQQMFVEKKNVLNKQISK